MNCKLIRRGISSVIVASLMMMLGGCGSKMAAQMQPMEIEEVHAVSFDFLGGSDVMPISGYYGPYVTDNSKDGVSPPNYISDEIFSLLSECGVNMTHYAQTNYVYAPELVEKTLKLGEKYNVGIFVYDTEVTYSNSKEKIGEKIAKYYDYPAFCGMYLVDEPGTEYFHPELLDSIGAIKDYAPAFQILKEYGVTASGNLCPVWTEGERDSYQKYVEEYISTCEPPYVSFDYYVFDADRTKADYFYNIDIIRHYAEEYEIPFWMYVQAGGQWNDGAINFDSGQYFPTEGEMKWNVNTALAYGAKGIEYFPLIQPYHFAYALSTDYDFKRNGLIGAWGNKTQWWYYAQNINSQIAAVDSVLMNSVNRGVIATGEKAKADLEGKEFVVQAEGWREVTSIDGNTLTGCFNYQGKTALYVVNYETHYAQKVTLNLQNSYNVSITQDTETSRVCANEIELDMQPGEGVLVVFD